MLVKYLFLKQNHMVQKINLNTSLDNAMSFKVGDNKVLKRCNKICEKINNLMNIEFDSEPVSSDNDKYIKTKIKMYEDRVNTNFQSKKVPKENTSYKCLSLIMLDSVIRVNKKYHPQTLWKSVNM